MNLLRTTCDRCYAAKTRCAKEPSSSKCRRCTRAGADCNYSLRGQAGRPLGSTSSGHASSSLAAASTNTRATGRSSTSRASRGAISSSRNVCVNSPDEDAAASTASGSIVATVEPSRSGHGADARHSVPPGTAELGHHVMTMADDGFSSANPLHESDIGSLLHDFVPGSGIDPSIMSIEDLVQFTNSHGSLTQGTTLPLLLDGKTPVDLDTIQAMSPAMFDFASASSSSTSRRHSNPSSASPPSRPLRHPQSGQHQQPDHQERGRPSSGRTRDATPSSDRAPGPISDNLHSRLAVIHHQLVMLSEALTVSFNMAEDVEEIYRASRDFKAVLDIYPTSCTSSPPIPIGKCQGMTSILILGCYSYLMEAFELMVENIQQGMQQPDQDADVDMLPPVSEAAGSSAPWAQPQTQSQSSTPSSTTLPASSIPDISVGSVRIPMSKELTAHIHKRLIDQTARDLKTSLRQCVERMAAVHHVNLEAGPGDESWNPIAKLTELGQRELQRREDGIFMYLRQGL